MNATAAVLNAVAPRATSTPEPRDTASEHGKFDQQLDAARQKQAPPEHSKKAASDEHADHDVKSTPTTASATSAAPAKTADTPTPAKDADDDTSANDDTSAGALAAAVLALLGPASTTLRPLAAGMAAAKAGLTGKTAAGDAAAALLKLNTSATGATANANAMALPPGAGIMLAIGETKSASVNKAGDAAAQPVASLTLPATSTPTAQAVHQLQIPTPVGSQGFAQELGQQVAWLGGQDVKQARIRLHPEDLGQLDIKVSVNHNRVDVVFSAQHPGAVTAVQQSLPQLDQMLGQHGLSLGHAEVGQHDRGGHGSGAREDTDRLAIDEVGEIHGVAATTGSVSLLDAFA